MVQIHITELFIDSAGRESMFGKITLFFGGPFAAVVFMSVMGYFIAKNRSTFAQNTRRGVKIFFLGLLVNVGLNFHLFLKIGFAGWQYNPLKYVFGIDILYLAGMSIIVLAALKTLKKGQEIVTIILFLAIALSTGFMNEKLTVSDHYYLLPFIAGNYSWSYFPLFPWLVYPLTGFIVARHEQKIKHFRDRHKAVVVIFLIGVTSLVILFFKQGLNTTIDLPAYYHHAFGYIMWALGITLLWILFLQLLLKLFPDTFIGNFFCWIGENITVFYVIQWLIIGNISTAIYQNQNIGQYWYWFSGIFAISVMLTFLYERVKTRMNNHNKMTSDVL